MSQDSTTEQRIALPDDVVLHLTGISNGIVWANPYYDLMCCSWYIGSARSTGGLDAKFYDIRTVHRNQLHLPRILVATRVDNYELFRHHEFAFDQLQDAVELYETFAILSRLSR